MTKSGGVAQLRLFQEVEPQKRVRSLRYLSLPVFACEICGSVGCADDDCLFELVKRNRANGMRRETEFDRRLLAAWRGADFCPICGSDQHRWCKGEVYK
jgi:hypothetical protein